ncbi:ATP-binding protein [Psychrobacter sp. I-STPA6b]|uniref:ATP-binding protein n=1 Tax=Psychrobacter sp. I-STPA6b TaxID=2585718 RepID=UPI001D0C70E0|nr:ATP-binding protein [Psychrobacter sp. I-STPA6b]
MRTTMDNNSTQNNMNNDTQTSSQISSQTIPKPSTGLTAIILHDSYFRGKRTRIVCDGHTNNTGDNGAGKTSALNLIPIFYGQEPNKLITRAGNKSSFIEYYLPSNQSLIIFEYTRAQGSVHSSQSNSQDQPEHYCVCLYRKRNDSKYAYRFIKGRADDTIFHPDLAHLFADGLSSHEILLKLSLDQNFTVSNQIDNIIDYRDIIQNDYQNLRKRNNKNSGLLAYPRMYGLAKERVRHLGALTSVVLRHDKLLAQFKTMLVDCFLKNEISIQQAPTYDKNHQLIDDLRSLRAFGQHRHSIEQANGQALALLQNWVELDSYMQVSEQSLAKIGTHQQQLSELKDNLTEQYNQIKESHNQQIEQLKRQLSETKIELDTHKRRLTELNKEQQYYHNQQIDDKRQALSNLDEYQHEYERKQQLLADLQQSFAKQTQDYESKLRQLESQLAQTTERVNSQIEQIRKRKDTEISHVESQREQRQAVNQNKLEEINTRQQQQIQERQQQARPIELAIEMIKRNVLSDTEEAQKQQLITELEQANHKNSQWYQEIKQLQADITEIEKQQARQQKRADDDDNLAQRIQSRIKELERQLNPEDNSLLSVLKGNKNSTHGNGANSAWQQTIAKVIDPSLIHRTDLNPIWQIGETGVEEPNFYGLNLNLDPIDIPDFASDDLALRQRIDEQVRAYDEIKQQLNEHSKALHELKQALTTKNTQKTLLENNISKNNAHIEQIKQRQTQFDEQCQANQKQRLDEQTQKLAKHQQQLDELREKHKLEKQQKMAENQQAITELNQKITAIKQSRDNDIDEKNQIISKAKADKQQQQTLRTQAYEQALREKGVDTQTLNSIKNECTQLHKRYELIKGYEKLVGQYERWLKTEWIEEPNLKQQIEQFNDSITQLDDDIEQKQQQQQQALHQKNQELKQVAKRLANLQAQQDRIESWQKQARPNVGYLYELQKTASYRSLLAVLPNLSNRSEINSADLQSSYLTSTDINWDSEEVTWLTSIDTLVSQCEKALESIYHTAQSLYSDMSQYMGSKVYKAWQNRQSQYRQMHQIPSSQATTVTKIATGQQQPQTEQSTASYGLSMQVKSLLDVLSLQQVMNEDFIQLQKSIYGSFDSIGIDLSNYYHVLDKINSKVKSIGNRLAKDINTQHEFTALSDIRIELTSKIHEYAIWQELQVFNDNYEKWRLNSKELPDEAFINSFERVATSFAQTQIDLNIDSLVEMTIQITENGRQVPIKTDNDLQHASSTGLSMLAVIVVFCGMTRYLCPDDSVTIHWPLDEIGKLSGKNTVLLFNLMEQYNVTLFCAQPDASPALNRFFVNKNLLDFKKGVRQFEVTTRQTSNPLLKASLN